MALRSAAGRLPTLGLVVGKFAPLHLGHEWMIDQAARQCDRLTILSYVNPEFEGCAPESRRRWLMSRFPAHQIIVFDAEWLAQECVTRCIECRPLPANESSDVSQQVFLAWLLDRVLQLRPDVFFCSEAYGPDCAQLLTRYLAHPVRAVAIDLHRTHMPMSASQIRQHPVRNRTWMSANVRASFVRRIALLGGESTGKTTLAAALAAHFETDWVAEYGRELWEKQSGILAQAELTHIALEQIRREESALSRANGILICDTSPLTTMGYSGWMFGNVDPTLAVLADRPYHAMVVCQPDFPFVQDGTRRDDNFRLQQHRWYVEQLTARAAHFLLVRGDVSARVAAVAEWLTF